MFAALSANYTTCWNALMFLTFDKENPNSIISCVGAARENARCVRERISSELWIAINQFYLKLNDPEMPKEALAGPHAFYNSVKEFSQLTAGIIQGTMNHDVAWNFTHLGTLLERADQTSRILDVKYYILLPDVSMVGMALDTVQWNAVLKSVGAYEMFPKIFRVPCAIASKKRNSVSRTSPTLSRARQNPSASWESCVPTSRSPPSKKSSTRDFTNKLKKSRFA